MDLRGKEVALLQVFTAKWRMEVTQKGPLAYFLLVSTEREAGGFPRMQVGRQCRGQGGAK